MCAAFYKSIGQLYGALFTFMGSKFILDQDICLHKFKIASCKIDVNVVCIVHCSFSWAMNLVYI